MLRSKSRTISASKLCRGDSLVSQTDTKALISVDQKPPKVSNFSENRIERVLIMQQQAGRLEDDLKRAKEQLGAAEKERDRTLDELRDIKQLLAHEAKTKQNEGLSLTKAREASIELKAMKEMLSYSKREIVTKQQNIESLKLELENAKQFEVKLTEREVSMYGLKQELSNVKASENRMIGLLSESKKRIKELEDEIEMGKLSESKMFDSSVSQTKQLEQSKIQLEESKLEITSLHEKIQKSESSSWQSSWDLNGSHSNAKIDPKKEALESLKSELQLAKESLIRAQDGEKVASLKAKSLLDKMGLLENEVKLATEAEEKSRKAMDDLALALKEVATEANQAKEKLSTTEVELEHIKGEAEQVKVMVRSIENRYQKPLDEAKKEMELYRNTADRLRLEAEESLLAWNGKEMGFVNCIKRAEEESSLAQHENTRLAESLKAAEKMTRTAREESYKLRDILKQALNEASVAKEAASIAKAENSQLKDSLAEKDEALHFLTQENERLRINESAAHENAKELKRLLSTAATKLKINSPNSLVEEEGCQEKNKIKRSFSFNLNELKFVHEHEDETLEADQDTEKAEALKGSIFDTAVSPKSELHTPKSVSHHRISSSSALTNDGETINSEDFDHLDVTHFDDTDSDKNSHRRRRALLRKFSDLIMRRSFYKKEPSTD